MSANNPHDTSEANRVTFIASDRAARQIKDNLYNHPAVIRPKVSVELGRNLHRMEADLRIATSQSPHLVEFNQSVGIALTENDPYTSFYNEKARFRLMETTGHSRPREYILSHVNAPIRHRLSNQFGYNQIPHRDTPEFLGNIFGLFDAVDSLHNFYYLDRKGDVQHSAKVGKEKGRAIVHSDISLDNIGIKSMDYHLFLFDYDAARYEGQPRKHIILNHTFSAPELEIPNFPAHPSQDVYSLGVVLGILFNCPHSSGLEHEYAATRSKKREGEPMMGKEFCNEFPDIGRVINKATAIDFDDRYQTIQDFWKDFSAAWIFDMGNSPELLNYPFDFSSTKAAYKLIGIL